MQRTDRVSEPVFNRRRVLAGGAALAVFVAATPGCSAPPAPPAVDELEAQLARARQDSELATAAVAGAPPSVVTALRQVTAERTQHAQALSAEIKRLAPTSTSPAAASSDPTASAATTPPPPLAAVVASLKASADSAGTLAGTSSGYRAGLLGSIAAACTASYTVALALGTAAS